MKITRPSLLGVSLFWFVGGFAAATPISVDDPLFGADSVTRQISGREWLDLDKSRDCSYLDVQQGTGCGFAFSGWRHATAAEILDLWFEAGFAPGNYGSGPQFLAIDRLGALMGYDCAEVNQVVSCKLSGVFNDDLDGVNSQFVGVADLFASTFVFTDAAGAEIRLDAQDESLASSATSNWLVRRLPEPATLTLVGAALFGFAATLRKI
jgi:hypothetical protein